MPVVTRSQYRIAESAKQRILDYLQDNKANEARKESILRAHKNGYNNIVIIIQYIINKCNTATQNEKTILIEKLFSIINKNPNILIFEPRFREVIINKMNEFERQIDIRSEEFKNAKINNSIDTLKLSILSTIKDVELRDIICGKFDSIKQDLFAYEYWCNGILLKEQINNLRKTLEEIKTHPSYVL